MACRNSKASPDTLFLIRERSTEFARRRYIFQVVLPAGGDTHAKHGVDHFWRSRRGRTNKLVDYGVLPIALTCDGFFCGGFLGVTFDVNELIEK